MANLSFPIQKEYILADVVEQWPVTAMVMLRYGLHCVGCQISAVDSVEEGAASHGMPEDMIDKMLGEMNQAVQLVAAKKALEDKRAASGSTSASKAPLAPTAGTTALTETDASGCTCGAGGCGCGGQGHAHGEGHSHGEGHEHGAEHVHGEGHSHSHAQGDKESGDACACGGACGC